MNECNIVPDHMVKCPLLDKNIPEGLCYDIRFVAYGMCDPELINYTVTREEAKSQCTICENKK